MAAEGNYIVEGDLTNWAGGATEAQKLVIIERVEERVERLTGDLFYSVAFSVYRDGNGESRLNVGLKPDILTVTAIELSGVALSTDYWTYDEVFVYRDPENVLSEVELRWLLKQYSTTGLFPNGFGNIKIVGTYGWTATPESIKEACILLAEDENDPTLYTHYIRGSENLGGYEYTREDRVFTGVKEADDLLVPFIRRKAKMTVI